MKSWLNFQPRITADLHTHSIGSGHAYSSIEEMCRGAKRRGVKMLAITDHGPAMPDGPHEYYFYNLRALPEYLHGIRLLRGVEANIISKEGKMDLPAEYLASYDVVIASAHIIASPERLSKTENTKMYLKVIQNLNIDILGHLENPQFELDYPKILEAAKATGKLVEINNASFTLARQGSYNNCLEIMRLIAKLEMPTVINSDAHVSTRVGEVDRAMELALKEGIKKFQILNLNWRKTAEYLQVKL